MRKVLTLGFYAEGSTDYAFLQPVIQRTAEQILADYGHGETDVFINPMQLTIKEKNNRDISILHAARYAYGYDILIIHSDADGPTADKAKRERFDPGLLRVKQTNELVCEQLVPIIPIQAIEAWLLADYELLLKEIGTDETLAALKIPEKARQVEKIANPKQRLRETVQKATAHRSRRKRETDILFLYQPMGEKINFRRLKQVPSYNQFVVDMTTTLKRINFIP